MFSFLYFWSTGKKCVFTCISRSLSTLGNLFVPKSTVGWSIQYLRQKYKSYFSEHILLHLLLGPELQSAVRDPKGPGEQQEHAGAESESQQHRLHPQPAVHQPDRPAVPGPERQQAGQPAAADETPGSPADTHTEQQPADACPAAVRRCSFVRHQMRW